jgi:hypothetical protein
VYVVQRVVVNEQGGLTEVDDSIEYKRTLVQSWMREEEKNLPAKAEDKALTSKVTFFI